MKIPIVLHSIKTIALVLLVFSMSARADDSAGVIHEGDRIVVVGDSITGQGAGARGYVGLMKEGLGKAHPGTKTTVVPLGGSGQTVGSWLAIEKNSRQNSFTLDVPGIVVKTTLDGGADVLIIMLGMNNVLRPDMDNTPEGIASWVKTYRELIDHLRERTHPRVIALATPTLCTEDESSPKNQVMDEMCDALKKLAASENCIVLPVRDGYKKMLREGRTYRPDFHITKDFVHPTDFGHLAIAAAMLKGLGEPAAAKAIYDARMPEMWKSVAGKLPALSYTLERSTLADGDKQAFKIRFWLTTQIPRAENIPAQVQLIAPEGWTVTPARIDAGTGEFTATGSLDHLENRLTLVARHDNEATQTDIAIPAPWLIGAGNCGPIGWINKGGFVFDPVAGHLPMDDGLIRGIGFNKPVSGGQKWIRALAWHPYVASIDYTGGADPGSVDIAAASWFGTFDVAYGARWIYSPTARTVPVEVNSNAFAAGYFLSLWLNGANLWESSQRTGKTELKLQKGWNALVFKSNHLEWQWQFQIRLAPVSPEATDDLRFSITPRDDAN